MKPSTILDLTHVTLACVVGDSWTVLVVTPFLIAICLREAGR